MLYLYFSLCSVFLLVNVRAYDWTRNWKHYVTVSIVLQDCTSTTLTHYQQPRIRTYSLSIIEQVEDESLLRPGYFFTVPLVRAYDEDIAPQIYESRGVIPA
jgi:hypothetical protein